jgi:hypothetical protein
MTDGRLLQENVFLTGLANDWMSRCGGETVKGMRVGRLQGESILSSRELLCI